MSINNFIPKVWSSKIDIKLAEFLVFAGFCNHDYEGDVQKAGDSVVVSGLERPTITKTTDGAEPTLADPESPVDTTITVPVLRQAYFNYGFWDVDKAQANGQIASMLQEDVTQGIANEVDADIASVAADNAAKKYNSSAVQITSSNVLSQINLMRQGLYENNVPANTPLELDISPRFYTPLLEAYVNLDKDNSGMMKNGLVGTYGGNAVKMSNNIATESSGATDLIILRTKRAITLIDALVHTEAYRPEKGFKDAVKGFKLYDRKLTRPAELIVYKAKYTA